MTFQYRFNLPRGLVSETSFRHSNFSPYLFFDFSRTFESRSFFRLSHIGPHDGQNRPAENSPDIYNIQLPRRVRPLDRLLSSVHDLVRQVSCHVN